MTKPTEGKGIDYSKDNIYDAIGRPDLKPKETEPILEIGRLVKYSGKDWFIVGLSCMEKDDDGEPEWKITKDIKEVALAEPFKEDVIYQKPFWISVEELKIK